MSCPTDETAIILSDEVGKHQQKKESRKIYAILRPSRKGIRLRTEKKEEQGMANKKRNCYLHIAYSRSACADADTIPNCADLAITDSRLCDYWRSEKRECNRKTEEIQLNKKRYDDFVNAKICVNRLKREGERECKDGTKQNRLLHFSSRFSRYHSI